MKRSQQPRSISDWIARVDAGLQRAVHSHLLAMSRWGHSCPGVLIAVCWWR